MSLFYTNLFVVSLDRRIKISDNFESLGQAKSNTRCHNRTLVTLSANDLNYVDVTLLTHSLTHSLTHTEHSELTVNTEPLFPRACGTITSPTSTRSSSRVRDRVFG